MYNKKKIIVALGLSATLLVAGCDSDEAAASNVSIRTSQGDNKNNKSYKTIKVLNDSPNSISKVVIKDGRGSVIKSFSLAVDPGSYSSLELGAVLSADSIIEIYDGKGDLVSGGDLADGTIVDGGNEYRIYNNTYTLGKYLVASYLAQHKEVTRQSLLGQLGNLFGLPDYSDEKIYAVLAIYMDKSGQDDGLETLLTKMNSISKGVAQTSSREDSSLLMQVKPIGSYLGQFEQPRKLLNGSVQSSSKSLKSSSDWGKYDLTDASYIKKMAICNEKFNSETQPKLFASCASEAQINAWGNFSAYITDGKTFASETFPQVSTEVMGVLDSSGVDLSSACPIGSASGKGVLGDILGVVSTVASFVGPAASGVMSGVTSIVGAICPSGGSGSSTMDYAYLDAQFNKVNAKLDKISATVDKIETVVMYSTGVLDGLKTYTQLQDYRTKRHDLAKMLNGIQTDYANYTLIFGSDSHKFLALHQLTFQQDNLSGANFSSEFWKADNSFQTMSQFFDAGGYISHDKATIPSFACDKDCKVVGSLTPDVMDSGKVDDKITTLMTDFEALTSTKFTEYSTSVKALCSNSNILSSFNGDNNAFPVANNICSIDVPTMMNQVNYWATKLALQLQDIELLKYRAYREQKWLLDNGRKPVDTRLSSISSVTLDTSKLTKGDKGSTITSPLDFEYGSYKVKFDPILDKRNDVYNKTKQVIMDLYQTNSGGLTPSLYSAIPFGKQKEMTENGCGRHVYLPDPKDMKKSIDLYRLNLEALNINASDSSKSYAILNCNRPVVQKQTLLYPQLAFTLDKYFVSGFSVVNYATNPSDTIATYLDKFYPNQNGIKHKPSDYNDGYVPEVLYSNISSKTTWYYNNPDLLFRAGDFISSATRNNDTRIPEQYLFKYSQTNPAIIAIGTDIQAMINYPNMLRNWYNLSPLIDGNFSSGLLSHDSAINVDQERVWMNGNGIGCSFKDSYGNLNQDYMKWINKFSDKKDTVTGFGSCPMASQWASDVVDYDSAKVRVNSLTDRPGLNVRANVYNLKSGQTIQNFYGTVLNFVDPRYTYGYIFSDMQWNDYQRLVASYIDEHNFVHLYSINIDYLLHFNKSDGFNLITALSLSCMQDSNCKIGDDRRSIQFSNGDSTTSTLTLPKGDISQKYATVGITETYSK